MASKQTYECFVCKKNGFPDTRVYLDGKTEDGKTIYKNEDMSPHQHKGNPNGSSQQQKWDIVNEKLDRILSMLEQKQHQ